MVTFGADDGRFVAAAGQAGLLHAEQLRALEGRRPVVPTGCGPLDALLPAGGIRRGSLVEWLSGEQAAGGAVTLALAVARRLAGAAPAASAARTIVVVDRGGWFHPPAVLPWMDDGRRLVVARPARDDDEIWTIDQALRCPAVAAVVGWPRMTPAWAPASRAGVARHTAAWATAMRRWQLAARASGAVGLLVRPEAACREPSWAESRIAVSALPGGGLHERRLRLALVGGAWSGADPDAVRAIDLTLDLPRGEMTAGRTAAGFRGAARHGPRSEGASCRAS